MLPNPLHPSFAKLQELVWRLALEELPAAGMAQHPAGRRQVPSNPRQAWSLQNFIFVQTQLFSLISRNIL